MHPHHSCVCQHARVRYCAGCRLVYCEDCRHEWVARPLGYYWYSGLPSYGAGLQGGLQGGTLAAQSLSNLQSGGQSYAGAAPVETTCTHVG
jgi:hypothetical protein